MRLAGRKPHGFTLFELVVCIIIISVLAAVLLNRLGYYKEMAEKAAMESTVRIIRTGLQIHLAELIIANRQGEAGVLETDDPVQWLEKRPSNYGGVYHDYAQPGTWYYDERERQLVYVVDNGDRLEIGTGADARQIRFRARLLKDRLQLHGTAVESATGVALTPVRPYRWQ